MAKQHELRFIISNFKAAYAVQGAESEASKAFEQRIFGLFDRMNDTLDGLRRACDNKDALRAALVKELRELKAQPAIAPQQPAHATHVPFDESRVKRGDAIEVLDDGATVYKRTYFVAFTKFGHVLSENSVTGAPNSHRANRVRIPCQPPKQVQLLVDVVKNGDSYAAYTSPGKHQQQPTLPLGTVLVAREQSVTVTVSE